MINSQMRDYIELCRSQGIADEQIKQALLDVGWSQQSIDEAFPPVSPGQQPPVIPIKPVYPPIRPHRSVGRILAITFVILIMSVAGTVVLAENGYLPAVSKIYRKTSLPLLWKGTNADAGISLAKSLQNISQEKYTSFKGAYDISVTSSTGNSSAYLRDIPLIGNHIAPILPQKIFANQPLIATQEAREASTTPLTMAAPAALKLPLHLTSSYTVRTDQNLNSEASLSVDIQNLVKAIPELTNVISPEVSTLIGTARVFPNDKKAYILTNALPAKSKDDAGKWFAYIDSSKSSTLKEIKPQSVGKIQDIKDLQELQNLIKSVTTDHGITRRDGRAVAHYTLTINDKVINDIRKSTSLRTYARSLDTFGSDSLRATIDIFIEPRSGRLREINVVSTTSSAFLPYSVSISSQNILSYEEQAAITPPSTSETHKDSLVTYWKNLTTTNSGELASTGIFTTTSWNLISTQTTTSHISAANATRKSDITDLGRTMEIYLHDNDIVTPPSTGNIAQRLDQANTALTSISGFNSLLPLRDPDPDNYYYAYKSDGANYEFTCVVLDTTTKQPSSVFGVRNGSTFEQPL